MAKSKPIKDFEKKVVKVGKIKKGPVNKTDTSFTSKKVVIRAQNIKSSSSGNDTEADLLLKIRSNLINCGHYNGNMRKDSTLNILKCIKEFPDLQAPDFLAVLDPIFVATFRQICDEEIGVRTALLGMMTFLFEQVKRENLGNFFPKWIAFLNLASSHIKPEIRKDSVRFISMTLKTQKMLFIPYLHTLLPTLIPLVTQYSHRTGAIPAFDCTMNLIDAYLEPFFNHKEAENLAKPLQSLVWKDFCSSSSSISVVRVSPFSNYSQGGPHASITLNLNSTKPYPISELALKSIVSHLGSLSISSWLDCAHLLSSSNLNLKSSNINSSSFVNKFKNDSDTKFNSSEIELKQLQDLLNFYRKLYKLTKVSGDENLFWQLMPVKLVKNYRSAIEKQIINKI